MNCEKVQEQLQDLLDGALSCAQKDALRGHLRACPSCARTFEAYRRVDAALAADADPPAGLTDAIMARVDAERRARSPRAWAYAAAAAAAALVAVIVTPSAALGAGWIALLEHWVADISAWLQPAAEEAARTVQSVASAAETSAPDWFSNAAPLIHPPDAPASMLLAAGLVAVVVDFLWLRPGRAARPSR